MLSVLPLFIKIPLYLLGGLLLAGLLALLVYFLLTRRANGWMTVNGERRAYILHLPQKLDPNQAVPLVLCMHGLASWPGHQERVSGWDKLADQEGFIVVYPRGTGFPLRWRDTNPQKAGNDVAFLSALIDKLASHYNIDPQRIYASGFSNGGGMAFSLSCDLSERIAAIGTVSGAYLYAWSECSSVRTIPLIAFHGTADKVVPYLGGPSPELPHLSFVSLPEWIAQYARQNGCQVDPQTFFHAGKASAIRYSGCAENAEVIFYTLQEGGHAWPGSTGNPPFISGETNQDIDATALIWQFFKAHPLP